MALETFCNILPHMKYLPEYDPKPSTPWHGIKALWYEGAAYQDQKTKVFAYIGYPNMAENQKVPAVVLVHGGGGHAFPEWIRRWNERGFAAIAMETTGYVPDEPWKGLLGTERSVDNKEGKYVHKLYGALADESYTLGPDNSGMQDHDLPITDQWMYHAVTDTILAHNILLNDPHILSDKIGIVGISWGAVITSIAIGYDNRYAFANPIYGSAFLDYQPAPVLPGIFRNPMVKQLWSAADRLAKVTFPVLWKCWCYDICFSIGANSLSYQATKEANAFLSMSFDMGHSHYCGWNNSEETYRFARSVVNGTLPLINIEKEPSGFDNIYFPITVPEDYTEISAALHYLTAPMEYDENNNMIHTWEEIPLTLEGTLVTGLIPKDAYCYFVSLKGYVDGISYTSNSILVERS